MKEYPNIQSTPTPDWDPAWSETVWDPALNRRLRDLPFDLILPEPRPPLLNMALDETLLYRVADGKRNPTLWFWDWTDPCIVIGSYQSVANEIDLDAAAAERFAFVRRISGGGSMLVEPGCTITYSIILPESVAADLSFVQSFAYLDQWCVRALRGLNIPVIYKPINDFTTPSGKLAGAAQCRRKKTILHHTTMAYDFDNERMMRIMRLRRPVVNPKGIPSAVKHVSPLNIHTALTRNQVVEYFAASFGRMFHVRSGVVTSDELAEARQRMHEKFSTTEWLYRVP